MSGASAEHQEHRPALSVLMLSWNTRELTLAALDSIYEHPCAGGLEVVVLDNASSDGSAAAIAERFPQAILVESPTNLGYGPGNNAAFNRSSGAAVLLLGSDTLVKAGTLDTLLTCLDDYPEAGAVTCRVEGPTGYPEGTCLGFPRLRDLVALYLSQPRWASHLPGPEFDHGATQVVQQVSGTCLMLRRKLIKRIGLFDEAYKILYTDVELCGRVHDAGCDIVYTGETAIVHYGSQSCVQATGVVRTTMYQDIARYCRAHFGRRSLAVMLPILAGRLALVNRGRGVLELLGPSTFEQAPGSVFGGTKLGGRFAKTGMAGRLLEDRSREPR